MNTLKEVSSTTKIPVLELRQPQFKLFPCCWEPSKYGPLLIYWTDNTSTLQNFTMEKLLVNSSYEGAYLLSFAVERVGLESWFIHQMYLFALLVAFVSFIVFVI